MKTLTLTLTLFFTLMSQAADIKQPKQSNKEQIQAKCYYMSALIGLKKESMEHAKLAKNLDKADFMYQVAFTDGYINMFMKAYKVKEKEAALEIYQEVCK